MLVVVDVLHIKGTAAPFILGGMALVQIAAAASMKLPRIKSDTKRALEICLRGAIVLLVLFVAAATPLHP